MMRRTNCCFACVTNMRSISSISFKGKGNVVRQKEIKRQRIGSCRHCRRIRPGIHRVPPKNHILGEIFSFIVVINRSRSPVLSRSRWSSLGPANLHVDVMWYFSFVGKVVWYYFFNFVSTTFFFFPFLFLSFFLSFSSASFSSFSSLFTSSTPSS